MSRNQDSFSVYSKSSFETQLLRSFVALNLPFRSVNNIQLRRLLTMLRPHEIFIPHAMRLKILLNDRIGQIEVELLNDLPDGAKISLALDIWTSPNNIAFMAIVGYFIDRKWKLREVLLGFEPLSGQHTGKKLAIVVNAVLDNYRLSDRVFALVTDNASNNGTLASELADMLLYFNEDKMHLPCLAHVVQLAI